MYFHLETNQYNSFGLRCLAGRNHAMLPFYAKEEQWMLYKIFPIVRTETDQLNSNDFIPQVE